jgi:NTE family protein
VRSRYKANAVFEGGGVKGIGIAGALLVAEQRYDWMYVAGTSAGALIAALVAAGYSAMEIRDLIFDFEYAKCMDGPLTNGLPIIGPLLTVIFEMGLYRGDYIEKWVREKLAAKGVRTFRDLVVQPAGHINYRYKLRLIASDVSLGRMLVLPQDLRDYGLNPDDLDVARAVRMSISIPFFFEPVRLRYKTAAGKQHLSYIVDGGVLSNYPVWLFDRSPRPAPTFGFKLIEPAEGRPHNISGPVSLFTALFSTMMEAHDIRYIKESNFARTIAIPTLGIATTDFALGGEKARVLYASGVTAAEKFFGAWNYKHYLVKYAKN